MKHVQDPYSSEISSHGYFFVQVVWKGNLQLQGHRSRGAIGKVPPSPTPLTPPPHQFCYKKKLK